MPSNKIYAILVLCIGLIVSIWLIQRKPADTAGIQDSETVSVVDNSLTNTSGADWQSVLTNIDTNSQKTTSVVPKPGETTGDDTLNDTTLTAQMAKDFFARYLSIANNGAVSTQDANSIANSILSSPEYTKTTGAVYTTSNLHITSNASKETVSKYLDALNHMLDNRGINNANDEPMAIIGKAVSDNNEKTLLKLDPIISQARGVITDLLAMSVPSDAVTVHLGLLNTSSNLLSNLEAMRVTFTDPVRSFAGASQYTDHLSEFLNAIKNMRVYFEQRL